MVKQIIFYIAFLIVIPNSFAQGFKTSIKTSRDTIKLGEPIEVTISITYPVGKQILFPDSLSDLKTFDFLSKQFFPTRSNDSTSTDSIIYTLSSFELQSPQYLKIPIYLITKSDSVTIYTDSLPIHIQEVINQLPQSIELKTNTSIITLNNEINFPLLSVFLGGIVVIIIVLFFLFGGKIIQTLQIRRIEKSHLRFKELFEKEIQKVEEDPTLAESVISIWKNHLSKISKKPFHSYSTSEIYTLTNNDQLKHDLRLFDQLIYSTRKQGTVLQAKDSLLSFAEELVKNRVNQIKEHGRKQ